MQICGLGAPELVIIALLAFTVFGPERTKEAALKAGRMLRRVVQTEWWNDFTRMAREIRDLPNTLIRLAELEETQAELEKSLSDLQEDIKEIDAPALRDVTTDPWGIANAVAGTKQFEQQDPEQQPISSEPAEDADVANGANDATDVQT